MGGSTFQNPPQGLVFAALWFLSSLLPCAASYATPSALKIYAQSARFSAINNQGTILGSLPPSSSVGPSQWFILPYGLEDQPTILPLNLSGVALNQNGTVLLSNGDLIETQAGASQRRSANILIPGTQRIAATALGEDGSIAILGWDGTGRATGTFLVGASQDIRAVGQLSDRGGMRIHAMNIDQLAVGEAALPYPNDPRFTTTNAALFDPARGLEAISIPSSFTSVAKSVNRQGLVAGSVRGSKGEQGFLWTRSRGVELISSPAGGFTRPTALNNLGDLVGVFNDTSFGEGAATQAFYRPASGELHALSCFVPKPTILLEASGINDGRTVIGQATASSGALESLPFTLKLGLNPENISCPQLELTLRRARSNRSRSSQAQALVRVRAPADQGVHEGAPLSEVSVELQRRAVEEDSLTWRTLKIAKTTIRGVARFRVSDEAGNEFRAVVKFAPSHPLRNSISFAQRFQPRRGAAR